MGYKIYVVDLTDEERSILLDELKKGKKSSRKLNRVQILLLADEGKTDEEIAAVLHSSPSTVQRTRQRFVEGNLENALNEKKREGGRQKIIDGKASATLIALTKSKPPEGRKRWTLELLADRLVELHIVDNISQETVRKELKKNGSSWV